MTQSQPQTAIPDALISISYIKPQVIYVGNEKTPVIVIDDFADDLTHLVDYACHKAHYEPDEGSYYPGVRSLLPRLYVIEVINHIFQLIYDVYNVPHQLQLKPQMWVFSLINQQPESLMPLQRLPHFDTPDPYHFAILHYLNNGTHGNTAFFRHKSTGLERIDESNMAHYFEAATSFLQEHQKDTPQYFTDSDNHYDIFHEIEYRPNRLVIYPGSLLHSTLVSLENDIDDNPSTGRLTANIFINFK
ncbi:DUF6445 family protein [Shewanella aestuarii]|uniref:2OG-Fe(II) oxygenase n=1 Tax=Shewanella aestuarii TaxID=1028752 RepID=A0A6G9QKB6_9GAMM|nr:DUF6445 family protein [Shewanella aestuarii]QIR14902.1 hypothetical protein HBH39_10740 [Shewanella aestuarii]